LKRVRFGGLACIVQLRDPQAVVADRDEETFLADRFDRLCDPAGGCLGHRHFGWQSKIR
jgi:hypothetical protein